jgi:hypothetical protein
MSDTQNSFKKLRLLTAFQQLSYLDATLRQCLTQRKKIILPAVSKAFCIIKSFWCEMVKSSLIFQWNIKEAP